MGTAIRSLPLDRQSRLWTLLAAAACLLPLLVQLPTRLALAISAIALVVGVATWQGRTLPVAVRAVLALLLVAVVLGMSRSGIGRDTGCALLAAMLALKPVELATLRDARSLIGFGLFAPFATFLLDQGPWSMVLGLIGVVLALAALLRLSELESGLAARALPPPGRLVMVLKLVGVGLPLALAAFWLFPRLATPLWGVPERLQARPGLSDSMAPGSWLDLMSDDTPALRATFLGAAPPMAQMYWRGPVFTEFDGRTWSRAEWLRGLPPPAVVPGRQRYEYELEMEPTDRRDIIALELPSTTPEGVVLSYEYRLLAPRRLSVASRWRLQAAAPAAFEASLPVALRQAALRLPDGYNPRTRALARQWRGQAGPDDAAVVNRALAWIGAEFAYTLDTPLLGRDTVDEFLFEQKAGFCEHFSSAFVVLMRAAGIPARVVTGYAGGYRNPFGDYWLVLRSDAHAWAEVWLPGRGWVRVDPTAAVAPERVFDTLADRRAATLGRLAPMFDASDWMRRGWNDFVLGFDAGRQRRLLRPFGVDELRDGHLIALFLAVLILSLGWMLWLTTRNERERDPVLRAWHRLGQRYEPLGLGREAHEPALHWARRVAAARGQAGALQALAERLAAWRYAVAATPGAPPRPASTRDPEAAALVRDLRAHRP